MWLQLMADIVKQGYVKIKSKNIGVSRIYYVSLFSGSYCYMQNCKVLIDLYSVYFLFKICMLSKIITRAYYRLTMQC